MAHTTVRISRTSHRVLKEIAGEENQPMLVILDRAIEDYRRRLFLESVNHAYSELRRDAGAWEAVSRERHLWDSALHDGLAGTGDRDGPPDRTPRRRKKRR